MFQNILLITASATSAVAHMQLASPPPFKASNNPFTKAGTADTTLLYPHNCCGKTTPMPCRGYLSLLGTPEGASVANWKAGTQQTWSISGPAPYGSNHYGGSCQVGFSTDRGKSFRVAASYEGNCPRRNNGQSAANQQFSFNIPSDLPNGEVVFAWTWINREQEFFMNCAAVTITGGSGGTSAKSIASTPSSAKVSSSQKAASSSARSSSKPSSSRTARLSKRLLGGRAQNLVERASTPFLQRPIMLFADVNNGCLSPKTTAELKYPNPGPDVFKGDGEYPLRLPTGNCA